MAVHARGILRDILLTSPTEVPVVDELTLMVAALILSAHTDPQRWGFFEHEGFTPGVDRPQRRQCLQCDLRGTSRDYSLGLFRDEHVVTCLLGVHIMGCHRPDVSERDMGILLDLMNHGAEYTDDCEEVRKLHECAFVLMSSKRTKVAKLSSRNHRDYIWTRPGFKLSVLLSLFLDAAKLAICYGIRGKKVFAI